MKEREINLTDIIVEILLKWRVFVILMVVGAVLMGAFSYVRSVDEVETQKAAIVATEQQLLEKQEELEKSTGVSGDEEELKLITEVQKYNVLTALNYEQYSADKQAYLENSVWANLDPMNIARTMLTFRVTGADRQTCCDIEKIYEDMFAGGVCRWVAENSSDNIPEAALAELIVTNRSSKDWETGADSFSVAIYHETEQRSAELAKYVIAYMDMLEQELVTRVGMHDVELIAERFSYVISTTLQDLQRNIQSNILSWNVSAAKIKDAFSEIERLYYNELVSDGDTPIPEVEKLLNPELEAEVKALEEKLETMTVSTPGVSMVYVVLGAILFAGAYVLIIFVRYIFGNKLRATDEVSQLFEIAQLGLIPSGAPKKRALDVVDKWILQLRDRNKRKFTTEEASGLAAVAVRIAVQHEGVDSILCIGCNLKGSALQVSDVIMKELAGVGIQMMTLNNILYNQEAMEQLQAAKVAFLLEQADSTLYEEISNELELLQRQEIKVLGAVVVE